MAARPSMPTLVALLLPLAGCLGGAVVDPADADAPAAGEVEVPPALLGEIVALEVEARDGTLLRGHVYLPKGEGPFATILNFSPYWNSASGHSEAQAAGTSMTGLFGPLLEAGFAIALVNVRGTGESEGCNQWFDFRADGADAYEIVQALAAESWSNGNVGMVGISWHGYSQYAALAEQPPALKAVAPASAILDLWTLFTRHGPTINTQFGPMATTYGAFWSLTSVGLRGDTPPSHLQCPEHGEQARAFHQLTMDGDKSEFFAKREAYEILRANEIPLLVTNGLTRLGEGHILQIDGLWDLVADDARLMVGQWPHAYPDDDMEDEYPRMLVRWFDHHLRDGPDLLPLGVVSYQDDADAWHDAGAWPPPGNASRVFLSDGKIVAREDEVAASSARFLSVYAEPRPDRCPAAKALYVSPPLAEDVLLAGNFRANVTLSSTLPNGNVGLHLWHVRDLLDCHTIEEPDLYAPLEVSRALSDLRHRGHLEQGRDFPIAGSDVLAMQSHPFASRVKAGERLVLGVAGGALELAPRPELPLLTVHTGAGIEGWIEIPVVDGELRFAT